MAAQGRPRNSQVTSVEHPTGTRQRPAILAELPPGNYTAIVRGVSNTTGVALVEVYDLH